MVKEVKTRWNSMFFLFQRLCELKLSVRSITTTLKAQDRAKGLSVEQWTNLEALVVYLEYFKVATEEECGYVLSHLFIQLWLVLLNM